MACHQPEEDAAQWRRRNGIERVDRAFRDTRFFPDSRRGGTRGHDITPRRMFLADYRAGHAVLASTVRSIWRCIIRILPHRMTGNRSDRGVLRRMPTLAGFVRIHLAAGDLSRMRRFNCQ